MISAFEFRVLHKLFEPYVDVLYLGLFKVN